MRRLIAWIVTVAASAWIGTAAAQDMEVVEEQQMTIPKGRAFVQAFVEMSLSDGAEFKPFSIAPDLWYGVSDEITVGLVHSGRGRTGFFGPVGNGLCLASEEDGCLNGVYDNVGIDGRYHFYREGGTTLSADGGLFLGPLDPVTLSIKVGAVGRWQSGALALDFSPSIFFGLTEREVDGGVGAVSNKERLFLPATVLYALMPELALAGQVGAFLPIEDAGDFYTIALSIGAQYMVTPEIMVDAAFSLPAVVGGELIENDGFDARTLTLGVGYAL